MTIRLLILGTGGMANQHAATFRKTEGVELVAGVDLNPDRLAPFCDKHKIVHRFPSLDEALQWGEFDAACNVTPDSIHHKTTMQLLAADKHVLCEKPLADNYADAAEMAQAAQEARVINMVNLSYRQIGALHHVRQMVLSGELGEIRHFEASYLQSWLTQPAWGDWQTEEQWLWRLSTQHGSMGVLGDVGVHILDLATFAANASVTDVSCRLKTFHKAPGDKIDQYPLDANDSFTMHLGLEGGSIGVIHASRFATGHMNDLRLRLYGTKGGVELIHENWTEHLRVCTGENINSASWLEVESDPVTTIYQRFAEAIAKGDQADPDFARGASLQQVIDLAVESNDKSSTTIQV